MGGVALCFGLRARTRSTEMCVIAASASEMLLSSRTRKSRVSIAMPPPKNTDGSTWRGRKAPATLWRLEGLRPDRVGHRDFGKAIADAPNGLDIVTCRAHLLPQALDVGIDGARGNLGVNPPHLIEQRAS